MKYFYPTLFLFLLFDSFHVKAQSWQYTESNLSQIYATSVLGDSMLLVNVYNAQALSLEIELLAFNKSGEKKWSSPGGRVMCITDSAIYTAATGNFIHDCGVEYEVNKIGFSGEEELNLRYDCILYAETPPVSIDLSIEEEVLIAHSAELIFLSGSLQQKNTHHLQGEEELLGAHYLKGANPESKSIALIFPGKIVHADSLVDYTAIFEFTEQITDYEIFEDTLYLLTDNAVLKMKDFTNEVEDTLVVLKEESEIREFKIRKDQLWLKTEVESEHHLFSYSLNDHTPIDTINLQNHLFSNVSSFEIVQNNIIQYGSSGINNATVISYSGEQSPEFQLADIGVSINGIEVVSAGPPAPGVPPGPDWTYNFKIYYSLQNKGSNTVNFVNFYAKTDYDRYSEWMDDGNSYEWTEMDLNLQPGESISLVKDGFVKRGSNTFCLWAMAPDSLIETSADDNYICDAVNNVKSEWVDDEISVFPNPASNKLFISSPSPTSSVKIYDNTGKVCLMEKNIPDLQPVDISRLENGIYFIQIVINEETVFMSKLIVSK